jgi:hypothetical protein
MDGVAGSNPADSIDLRVLSGSGLGDELITHPEESYRMCACVSTSNRVWSRNLNIEAVYAGIRSLRHRNISIQYIKNVGDVTITIGTSKKLPVCFMLDFKLKKNTNDNNSRKLACAWFVTNNFYISNDKCRLYRVPGHGRCIAEKACIRREIQR